MLGQCLGKVFSDRLPQGAAAEPPGRGLRRVNESLPQTLAGDAPLTASNTIQFQQVQTATIYV